MEKALAHQCATPCKIPRNCSGAGVNKGPASRRALDCTGQCWRRGADSSIEAANVEHGGNDRQKLIRGGHGVFRLMLDRRALLLSFGIAFSINEVIGELSRSCNCCVQATLLSP
jgi:hypothetical protein